MTAPRRRQFTCECAGVIALLGLAVWLILRSWRRWNDPIVDFGRELYTPWRLAGGAVLYRDVDDAYGPLSQYCNAGLFRIFGTGLMTLAVANLAVLGGILATAYTLLRRAYGPLAAWAACAVFLPVFGIADYLYTNNFNFVTPYAHEATHGLLVCLLLTWALARWTERPAARWAFLAGLCAGLTLVLKSEFILAAVALLGVAAVLKPRSASGRWPWMLLGGVLPSLACFALFLRHVGWADAARYAGHAWLAVVGDAGYAGDPVQRGFTGLDHAAANAWAELRAAAAAAGILGGLLAGAWLSLRSSRGSLRAAGLVVTAGAALAAGLGWVPWIQSGRCFLGLLLVYVGWKLARRWRTADVGPVHVMRTLLAVLALILLARMVLNGRIYQFGFYQAATAGLVIVAAWIGEGSECLPPVRGQMILWLGVAAALLLPGVVTLARASGQWFGVRTLAVGKGPDLFYGTPASVYPMATLVELTASHLRERPDDETVLVLPEGLMLNYLARKRSPVAPFFLFSVATAGDREAALVRQLEQHPPEWVVLVSRNLEEYGIHRYGEAPGKGQLLLNWLSLHYRHLGGGGGDPLDPRGCAIAVFKFMF